MSQPLSDLTALRRRNRKVEAELALLIDAHVEEVWAALTSPEWLAQWLAPGHIDARLGGAVELDFELSGLANDSEVTAIMPGALIEWSGPASELGQPEQRLRWSLEPIGPTTYLTLALSLPEESDAARACAGWAAHLDMLVAALAHIPVTFPVDVFEDARQSFASKLAELAAQIAA